MRSYGVAPFWRGKAGKRGVCMMKLLRGERRAECVSIEAPRGAHLGFLHTHTYFPSLLPVGSLIRLIANERSKFQKF